MALRTKLNMNDEETEGLDVLDDLDAAYVENLKSSGLENDFLEQFAKISRQLEDQKEETR